MSFSYSQEVRRRRVGTGFSASGRRTVIGYWVPLAMTVGVAAVGLAAWVWSERSDDEEEGESNNAAVLRREGAEEEEEEEEEDGYPPLPPGPHLEVDGAGEHARGTGTDFHDGSMIARMQGALRRTPSPQQIFDGASKRVAAGVAAAGAFVGGALTSIREENRGDFEDHSRWSEEVRSRNNNAGLEGAAVGAAATTATTASRLMSGPTPSRTQAPGDKKRKTVVIVVSSESLHVDHGDSGSEHASILSHLPEHVDTDTARVFVLIYAPGLKHAIGQGVSRPTLSVTSSYSNISREEARDPEELASGGELTAVEPRQVDEFEGTSPLFRTLYTQAQALVEKENMIMTFSTPTGHVHLIRHLAPEIVYVQESLAGQDGDAVRHISGWVRQVIVVMGDEGGRGGLIDSDDESALADQGEKWWEKEGTTGIGKRIEVVDVHRTGDDWRRRVRGYD
ncbi:hypothetical protein ASPZODRAFT_118933 [Penicilliopsis zonata CBS 506.65]|uniref:Peroxin-22-like protein Pex22-like-Penicillium chrysogenum n=1 Tax=Penicilliopsis zonata CBS 506.65 TaxID=1073090 RepID=A0A1L9SF02_9EURO|nr:hypothetical protein ASPZODRAFT_118933 [Penicilliopsis zonata CBS 506.65]OJJ45761.1 hypothetical protein ASPZODRAFT_118933 [Penicilliopsis zonata CBS 506.65]